MKPPPRVAVIGGSGFIGRHLVARLSEFGASVRVIGVSPSPGTTDIVRCDVRDADGLYEAFVGMDLVYNLAAAHGIDSRPFEEFDDLNVGGARSVCRAAAAAMVPRIVFTSTAAVYGHGRSPDETSPARPQGHYGVTKLAAEAVYRAWAGADATRAVVVVRPTVVFGPGGGGTGGILLRHLAGPRFAHIGEARNYKSLAYVENLAAFLVFAGRLPGSHVFNYADTPDLDVAEIASVVRSAIGLPPAPRRSSALALASSVRDVIIASMDGRENPSLRESNAIRRRLARDMRFNSDRAHRSGFHQPVPLRDALALTARTDVRWVALLSRARA